MGRRPCCSNKEESTNKGPWSAEEDKMLADHIKALGDQKWSTIPKRTGLRRCGKSCMEANGVADRNQILADCKALLTNFSYVIISHIFREANGVADRLAHIANSSFLDNVWLDETPVIIQNAFIEDLHDSFLLVQRWPHVPSSNSL